MTVCYNNLDPNTTRTHTNRNGYAGTAAGSDDTIVAEADKKGIDASFTKDKCIN